MLLSVLFCLIALHPAVGQFRYGQVSRTLQFNTGAQSTVRLSVLTGWQRSFEPATFVLNWGDGTSVFLAESSGQLVIPNATDASGEEYKVIQHLVEHTYPSAGTFTAFIQSCCRIPTALNAPQSNWRLESTVCVLASFNQAQVGSPQSLSPYVVQMPVAANAMVQLKPFDPLGLPVTCEFAPQASSLLPPPNIAGSFPSLSTDCILNWNTQAGTIGSKFALQVWMSEPSQPLGTVVGGAQQLCAPRTPVEFLVELVGESPIAVPTCTASLSGPVSLEVGDTVLVNYTGSSNIIGERLSFTVLSDIPGGMFMPPQPSVGLSPTTTTFRFTPTPSQSDRVFVLIVAYTNAGGSVAVCPSLTVQVGAYVQSNCSFAPSDPTTTTDPPAIVQQKSGFITSNLFSLTIGISQRYSAVSILFPGASDPSFCSFPSPQWVVVPQQADGNCSTQYSFQSSWIDFSTRCGMSQRPTLTPGTIRMCGVALANVAESILAADGRVMGRTIQSSLPFCLEFPTTATTNVVSLQVYSPSQVQAAILLQQFLSALDQPDINPFGPFGRGTIKLLTSTPFPFALSTQGPFVLKNNDANVAIVITPDTNSTAVCLPLEGTLCDQLWNVFIYPLNAATCELDGQYWANFNLTCQSAVLANGSCPLNLAAPSTLGVQVVFQLDTQSICPTVIARPTVVASLFAFRDANLIFDDANFLIGSRAYFQVQVFSPDLAVSGVRLVSVQATQSPPGAPVVSLLSDRLVTTAGQLTSFTFNDSLPSIRNEAQFSLVIAPEVFPLPAATSKAVTMQATVNISFAGVPASLSGQIGMGRGAELSGTSSEEHYELLSALLHVPSQADLQKMRSRKHTGDHALMAAAVEGGDNHALLRWDWVPFDAADAAASGTDSTAQIDTNIRVGTSFQADSSAGVRSAGLPWLVSLVCTMAAVLLHLL